MSQLYPVTVAGGCNIQVEGCGPVSAPVCFLSAGLNKAEGPEAELKITVSQSVNVWY